jgi:hypothetical protein
MNSFKLSEIREAASSRRHHAQLQLCSTVWLHASSVPLDGTGGPATESSYAARSSPPWSTARSTATRLTRTTKTQCLLTPHHGSTRAHSPCGAPATADPTLLSLSATAAGPGSRPQAPAGASTMCTYQPGTKGAEHERTHPTHIRAECDMRPNGTTPHRPTRTGMGRSADTRRGPPPSEHDVELHPKAGMFSSRRLCCSQWQYRSLNVESIQCSPRMTRCHPPARHAAVHRPCTCYQQAIRQPPKSVSHCCPTSPSGSNQQGLHSMHRAICSVIPVYPRH